jgi:hypothetical protein
LENDARSTPNWMTRVRPPGGPERFYDKAMPALMRGFDRRPLHLTRRQYTILQQWVEFIGTQRNGKRKKSN